MLHSNHRGGQDVVGLLAKNERNMLTTFQNVLKLAIVFHTIQKPTISTNQLIYFEFFLFMLNDKLPMELAYFRARIMPTSDWTSFLCPNKRIRYQTNWSLMFCQKQPIKISFSFHLTGKCTCNKMNDN